MHLSLDSPRQTAFDFIQHKSSTFNSEESTDSNDPNEDEIVIFCHLSERLFPGKESYRLTISDDKIRVVCSDLSGLHHAIVTLVQLFRLFVHESTFREENPLESKNNKQSKEKANARNDYQSELAEIIPVYISDNPDCALRAVLLDLNLYGRVPKKVFD